MCASRIPASRWTSRRALPPLPNSPLAIDKGQVAFHGSKPAAALLCRLMRLPERPTLKQFRFAPFPTVPDIQPIMATA